MMKSTTPKQYKKAAHLVTEPTEEKKELVEKINFKLMEQTISLFAQYPNVASTGRPIHTKEDDMVKTDKTFVKEKDKALWQCLFAVYLFKIKFV